MLIVVSGDLLQSHHPTHNSTRDPRSDQLIDQAAPANVPCTTGFAAVQRVKYRLVQFPYRCTPDSLAVILFLFAAGNLDVSKLEVASVQPLEAEL